jgi:hypothetical protein
VRGSSRVEAPRNYALRGVQRQMEWSLEQHGRFCNRVVFVYSFACAMYCSDAGLAFNLT